MFYWFKAIHLIAMVTWFSGLFYIFRIFVYHIEAKEDILKNQFKIMENKVYKIIMNPSMMINFIFGLATADFYTNHFKNLFDHPWLCIKIVFVFCLIGYHHYCKKIMKQLDVGTCKLTSKQARILNEVPAVFLILIVILAVVKPFN